VSALLDVSGISGVLAAGGIDASRKDIGPIASRESWRRPWSLHAPHPSALPYSFRYTLQRIKRKTHGRTPARESSCCVRPFRGRQERVASKGVARMSLCTLPDLIKGPFATDGWLFAGDFVKDFSVVDGPGNARSRHRRLLVFLSLPGQARPIYFRLCSYWSTEISFRLRVISTGAKEVRLTCESPLRFRAIKPRLHTPSSTFSIFGIGWKIRSLLSILIEWGS